MTATKCDDDRVQCPWCDGRGHYPDPTGMPGVPPVACRMCDGTGMASPPFCAVCGGRGEVWFTGWREPYPCGVCCGRGRP